MKPNLAVAQADALERVFDQRGKLLQELLPAQNDSGAALPELGFEALPQIGGDALAQ